MLPGGTSGPRTPHDPDRGRVRSLARVTRIPAPQRKGPLVRNVPRRVRRFTAVLVAVVVFAPSAVGWADTDGTTEPPTTTTTTLAPDGSTTTTPEVSDPQTDPDTTGTGTEKIAALDATPSCEPGDEITGDAGDEVSEGDTPVEGLEIPSETCDPDVEQKTKVSDNGNALANTGTNSADNIVTGGGYEGDTDSVEGRTATITTGSASANGGNNATAIAQTAAALVNDDARVVIYQLAIVLNVGLALSQSGDNIALAGPESSGGQSEVMTGNATATGLSGSTAVTQVVQLLDENKTTEQKASIVNVGVGTANSGGNLAILHTGPGVDATAMAVSWGPTSSVTTGGASAVGDASTTRIVQVAIGTASDDGAIYIKQQAIVVNFGAAFANSGGNGAFSGGNSDSLMVDSIVTALVYALLGAHGLDLPEVMETGSGTEISLIGTGNASATGNKHDTSITQIAKGSVSGDHVASADQDAAVGNYGIATANTGLNTAGDASDPTALLVASTVNSIVDGLIGLAQGPVDAKDWSKALTVGNMFLEAYSSLSAADWSTSSKDEGGSNSRVRIRQVVAVMNLMFALAVTGSNHAATSDSVSSTDSLGEGGESLVEVANAATGLIANLSKIHTGNATAQGNDSVVVVCQTIQVSSRVCAPPDTPKPPVVVPAVPVQAPAQAPATTTRLAFTGSDLTAPAAGVGVFLVVLGMGLVVAARRRTAARR